MSAADTISAIEYRTIPNYPGYQVGSDGSVWSSWRSCGSGKPWAPVGKWKKLKPWVDEDGYHSFRLKNSKGYWAVRCHRLVLMMFIGGCPKGMVAAHNDGNPANNCVDNLRWDTQAGNVADKVLHGTAQRGERHGMAKLTIELVLQIRRRRSGGESYASLASTFGVSQHTIEAIVTRRLWRHVA